MARTYRDKDGLLLLADGADSGETAGAKAAAGWGIEGAGNGTLQDDPLPAGIAIHHRHGGHQCLRVGMGRLGKDLIRRPLTGEIDFAVTQLYPAEARSGSGVLATVIFEPVGQGTSPVQWVGVRLLDDTPQDSQEIPTGTHDGEIVVEGGHNLYLPLILRDG